VGIASTFYPKEKYNDGQFACAGRTKLLPKATMQEWTDETLPVCAHRTLPCGTWIQVKNVKTKATSWCVVADRGPYGALTSKGKWVLKRPNSKTKGRFNRMIDLGPTVAEKAATKGLAKVQITAFKPSLWTLVLDLWFTVLRLV
jgi:hypothetical protein